jgi:hypothetical protein
MSTYASFQGRVYLGKRDASGNPVEVRSPGNVAELKLSLKTEVLEHFESQTGQRTLDHRMVKQKSATVMLTIEEFTKENLALALYGSFVQNQGGTVQAELIPHLVVGDRFLLAHPKVSGVIVKDSSPTPKTLAAGTDYTLDADFGAIQLLRLDDGAATPTAYVAPLKVNYSYGQATEIGIFTQPLPERFLRLEGLNTAQGNAKVLVELYRVAFDPLKELSLISDEYNKFELEGSLLADPSKPIDAVLGSFGRIVQL